MRRANPNSFSPGLVLATASLCMLATADMALGADWPIIGARQRGMGGAGVATADDSSAMHWNPAALGMGTKWGARLDIDAGAALAPGTTDSIAGFVEDIQTLQADFDTIDNILSGYNQVVPVGDFDGLVTLLELTLVQFSSLRRHDLGMFIGGGAGVRAHVGNLAFSGGLTAHMDLGVTADLSALAFNAFGTAAENMNRILTDATPWATIDPYPEADPRNGVAEIIEPIFVDGGGVPLPNADQMAELMVLFAGTDGPNAYSSDTAGADIFDPEVQQLLALICQATVDGDALVSANESGVTTQGLLLEEYTLSGSLPIVKDVLSIGASARMMTGTTYEGRAWYDSNSTSQTPEDFIQDLMDNIDANGQKDTNTIGIDLGVLWKPTKFLRLGITGKNINSPEFNLPVSSGSFVLEPQWRMGVAVYPTSWICCALDVDVTDSYSKIADDYGTRFYALGVEVGVLKVLQLRAGTYGNLLVEDSLPAYTVGLGLKLGSVFSLDLAANVAGNIAAMNDAISGGDFDIEAVPESAGFSLSMQLNTRF